MALAATQAPHFLRSLLPEEPGPQEGQAIMGRCYAKRAAKRRHIAADVTDQAAAAVAIRLRGWPSSGWRKRFGNTGKAAAVQTWKQHRRADAGFL